AACPGDRCTGRRESAILRERRADAGGILVQLTFEGGDTRGEDCVSAIVLARQAHIDDRAIAIDAADAGVPRDDLREAAERVNSCLHASIDGRGAVPPGTPSAEPFVAPRLSVDADGGSPQASKQQTAPSAATWDDAIGPPER